MKKIIIIFITLFLYGNNIEKQIQSTKTTLNQTQNKLSNMNQQLSSLLKEIKKRKAFLNNINNQITVLNGKIIELQNNLKINRNNLLKLELEKEKLIQQKKSLEKEVLEFFSNNFYIQNEVVTSEQDLINNEILKVITKESAKKMAKIADLYQFIEQKIKDISALIDEIKNSKKILIQRKKEIAILKKKQYQYLENLKKQKISYKQEIQKIIAEQTNMQNQLAKLKIIKKQEIEKAKEAVRLQKQTKKLSKAEKIKVKNYGNVYMKTKSARYQGPKTIPPLKKGKIIKRFGSYTDPIYHISLYNDSITFKVNKTTKIYSILDGKVVFVKKNGNNKMIVIQHNHSLHSIYAKLSLISPFIKKGYRVKKGEVIAKTNNELEFEVTYKTLPINPMQIIEW